eukprot:gene332-964_t
MADQEYAEGQYYEENGNGDDDQQYTVKDEVHDEEMADNIGGVGQSYTDFHSTLQGQGFSEKLAGKIGLLVQNGVITSEELDDRALDALKEFSEEDAIQVVEQFSKSDLSHVQNKSAFLCGVMKTHRTKTKQSQKEKVGSTADTQNRVGPNEDKIKELLNRTGYSLDITTGQRKYGGPPPGWEGDAPGTGTRRFCSQIFVGKLPRDMFEDELVPMFEKFGQIYDFRLMIDSFTGLNKGYGFCTYATKEAAQKAVREMDKYEVRGGRKLGVCLSLPNDRLFIGSIPKSKTKQQIHEEFAKVTEGLSDVIVYISSEDKTKNRGFAFLQYESHKAASLARRRLMSGKIRVFGNITPTVDWADPQEEPDDDIMQSVKVVYVRNLTINTDEDKIQELFKQYGPVEKVKKIKDYAFIHFVEREHALKAIEELNGQEIDEQIIEVALAKPQSDKRERRRGMSGFGALNATKNPPSTGAPMRGGRGGRGMSRGGGSMRGSGGGGGRGGGCSGSRYDDWGYDSYGSGGGGGGYDQGYSGGYGYDRGYDEGYQQSYGGGYGDSYYDDYYGSGADQSYDNYYDGPSTPRGSRGGMGGGSRSGGGGGSSSSSGGGSSYRGSSRGGSGTPRGGGPSGGRGGPSSYGGQSSRGGPRGGPRGGGRGAGGRVGSGGPGRGGNMSGAKRKMEPSPQSAPKRPYNTDQWNSPPIAQQPLSHGGSSGGGGGGGNGDYYGYGSGGKQEWYQDSYGQQWK